MPADLIVYALIAAGLVFWLRSVLGTRHGEERDRPNPLAPTDKSAQPGALPPGGELFAPVSMEQKISELAAAGKGGTRVIDNKTAETGLIEIARADSSFDIDFFLDAAQEAFAMIVEGFAAGDREMLRDLLEDSVYKAFDSAIIARESRQETQTTDIHAIRRAEVTGVRMEGRKALITVRFTAEETSVTRDSAGNIIHGHPDKISQMKDIWTFSRDIRSKDPAWRVCETRGDVEGDNEMLPNTH